MADQLDIAKFELDRYEKLVKLQIEVSKAEADYNFRMMEVAELQIKVETDGLRLAILGDAFESYRIARRNSQRVQVALQEKLEKYVNAIARLVNLTKGESATLQQIYVGWRGFWFLVSRAEPTTVYLMGKIKCSSSDKKSTEFYFPADNSENAPTNITNSYLLMDWARKKGAVPRVGSKPQERLMELLALLQSDAKENEAKLTSDLTEAKTELKRIREDNWKLMDVRANPPKESKTTS